MHLQFLHRFNFNNYDLKALEYLIIAGSASAAGIAKQADIPTSKIYMSLRKLEDAGLVRLENTSPKVYAVVDDTQLLGALADMHQNESAEFARQLQDLSRSIAALNRERTPAAAASSITASREDYLSKHLTRLAEARHTVYTCWQQIDPDTQFLDRTYLPMFFGRHGLQHMLLAGSPVPDSHPLRHQVEQRRLIGSAGGNFHLWDGKYVLLVTGNAISGIRGSVLYQDADLYARMVAGFMQEWYRSDTL